MILSAPKSKAQMYYSRLAISILKNHMLGAPQIATAAAICAGWEERNLMGGIGRNAGRVEIAVEILA